MSIELILGLVTLFGTAAIGMPVAYAILVGVVVYLGLGKTSRLLGKQWFSGYSMALLLAVPLFIVSANIMNAGSISDRLLKFCVALVGRFRGGLGHVNVVASLIFSGMSGSAVADAAGIGKLIIDMMIKSGRYSPDMLQRSLRQQRQLARSYLPQFPSFCMHSSSIPQLQPTFLGGIVLD